MGSHLLFDLLQKDTKVRALRRKSSDLNFIKKVFSYYTNDPEKLNNKIEWIDGDILDIFSLEDALKGVDHVYNCAGKVTFDKRHKEEVFRVNIDGTANLVNAALENNVKKLCHVSSIAALGRASAEEYIDEKTYWKTSKNNSVYAISKYGSEREVWRGTEEGLKAVIVNPSIILGPGKWNEGSSEFFKKVYDGLKFYSTGVNGYVDVRDVSKAMIVLMESNIVNDRFILNSENISYKEFLSITAEKLDIEPPKYRVNSLLANIAWRVEKIRSIITGKPPFVTKDNARTALNKYYYSNDKIRKELNFDFRTVEEAVTDICKIFLDEKNRNK